MTTSHLDDTPHLVEVQSPSRRMLAALERHWRFSWGAVFAGAIVSIGIWLLLYVLGLGVGLAAINPQEVGSLRGAGLTTGIWSLIVPIVAMFLGGIAAARVAGPMPRLGAAIHGAVLWSLATLASAVLLVSVVSSLFGGVARLGGHAIGGTAHAVGALDPSMLGALGIDTDDLLGPVNEQLRATGNPELTGQQLAAATKDALSTAVREGHLDRSVIVAALADQTALTRAQAQDVASRVEQQWNQQSSKLGAQVRGVGTQALHAAETTGKGLLGLFLALLFGLGAAVLGAILGDSREQRLALRAPQV